MSDIKSEAKMLQEMGRLLGYAYGGYTKECHTCGDRFIGDKRAYQCLPCAVKDARRLIDAGARK